MAGEWLSPVGHGSRQWNASAHTVIGECRVLHTENSTRIDCGHVTGCVVAMGGHDKERG
jgi:hypothetical protein